MFKKICAIMLVALLVLTGCRAQAPDTSITPPPADQGAGEGGASAADGDWIIGIVTGTVSQGEEEFMAAQKMQERHGADRILHFTYPDRFNDEIETTIAGIVSLADQGAQAIIICQAVPGTIPAINRVRERNPDVLFIAGTIMEPPREIAAAADVVLQLDDIGTGITIMEMAAQMGAENFVHISFPRHLSIEMIALRRENLMATAERLGINFIDVMAPDPTGDAGNAGAQQFIVEEIPRSVASLGTETVFFSSNCVMQEPLIRGVLQTGALYVQPCCPSPYHAFPAAMNISTAGREGDVPFMLEQITQHVAEVGMTGRVSNWAVPVNMLIIESGVDYAINWLEGNVNGRMDPAAVRASLNRVADEYRTAVDVSIMEDDQGSIDNMFLLISDNVLF